MEELSVTSVLSLFDTNKEQRKEFAAAVVARMSFGTINPLNVHVQVKCMEDVIKKILEDPQYKAMVVAEAEKYGKKPFEFHNAEVAVKEAGIKYDYTSCNDLVYADLLQAYQHTETLLKEREKFLKTVPTTGMDIITEEGEVLKIYPPVKTSTTTTVVTLK